MIVETDLLPGRGNTTSKLDCLLFDESSGRSTLLAHFICSSDAQRPPRRYSGSPDPRDDRRERDPRSATGRATYDEVAPPPAEARY
jgi:hypothetical protein